MANQNCLSLGHRTFTRTNMHVCTSDGQGCERCKIGSHSGGNGSIPLLTFIYRSFPIQSQVFSRESLQSRFYLIFFGVGVDYTAYPLYKPGFRIRIWIRIRFRIGSVFNRASGSGSVFGIRIRIHEGKNYPQKEKKFMF